MGLYSFCHESVEPCANDRAISELHSDRITSMCPLTRSDDRNEYRGAKEIYNNVNGLRQPKSEQTTTLAQSLSRSRLSQDATDRSNRDWVARADSLERHHRSTFRCKKDHIKPPFTMTCAYYLMMGGVVLPGKAEYEELSRDKPVVLPGSSTDLLTKHPDQVSIIRHDHIMD